MREILAGLPARERAILALRFGLNDVTEKTLKEIGRVFGLTRERIRQIQEKALKELRSKKEQRLPGANRHARSALLNSGADLVSAKQPLQRDAQDCKIMRESGRR